MLPISTVPVQPATRNKVATILILDDDLGFTFWLGQAFSNAHCTAVPAVTVAAAKELIDQFGLSIDLAIVNPKVPGSAEFTRTLRRAHENLRVATLDLGVFNAC